MFGRNKNLNKKILILGSTGLIGHQIYTYLNKNNEYILFNLSKSKLNEETIICDVLNYKNLEKVILEIMPDFIINCIGILIQESELKPDIAIELNAKLPHKIKKTADKLNSRLIHLSTDCVFSGERGFYHENDFKDGKTVYAKSKNQGEIISKNHLTIRTSIIGPELKLIGGELFDWFMRQQGSIDGYTKSIWSGTTTYELAKMIDFSIRNRISGLYNFSNLTSINKYDLLCLIKHYFDKDIVINKVDGLVTNKILIDNRKLVTFERLEYKKLIENMYINIKNSTGLYKQYEKYIKLK